MSFRPVSLSKLSGVLFLLVISAFLTAQTTTINVGSTAAQTNVQRLGINLGQQAFYDSGQMLKNLVFTNPSFEGEIYQSTVECGGNTYITPNQSAGSATSCTDANIYAGWTGGFWNNASYTVISGSAVGRTGTICSYSPVIWNGTITAGVFNFCDSGTAPSQGDYIVVKRTMPPSLGWPSGDWQTVVGNGAMTPETNDLPPGTLGKQSALLTAPTAADGIGVNMFFDSTAGKTFVQLNGNYQLTFKAKGTSGSKSVAISLTRAPAGLTYINATQPLTGAWQTYTINFSANENGSDIGRVELSFSTAGADAFELDDVSLVKTGTDPTNTTVFRDEVVNALQALHPGVLRMWEDQLGESLDNMLTSPTGKQRSAYTPYNGYDGTDVNFQTQTLEFGLTDFLQLCQKVGADPWIVVPSTFSTGEAYSLIDYLAGNGSSTYGAKRIAAGQTAPWTSVFHQIHLEYGNEEWNGGTFKGGAIEVAPAYGQAATNIFAAMIGNASFSAPSFDLIIDGQSANPGGNQYLQSFITNNNSFSVAPYMMYNINNFSTNDQLFGTTFAEAEAFVSPSCVQSYPLPPSCADAAEGVDGGFITDEQAFVGKPIVTSEMNLSPSSGNLGASSSPGSQAALNGYASSVGGGIAVLDAMFQQLRAGVRTQNLFELPGYVSGTNSGNTMDLWGAVVDMGVTNRVRPQYLALQLANSAIGNATTEVQTTQTGANPTDTQYNFGVNSVTLPQLHFLQSFAFTGVSNGSSSLVVFNVSPDYSEPINFAGANAPTGTVQVQQLTSGSITDTNESSTVVTTKTSTLSGVNGSTLVTLPAYSMTVFTWGGTTTAPAISAVSATSVSPTSETITWTTDQPSSSQVNYGTSTSYGSSSTLNSSLVTSHSVTLTGLTAGTLYDFDVVSTNGSSLSSTSSNSTFTTAVAPPVISNVNVTGITTTGATITWTTDESSSSQVSYGTTTAYGAQSTLNGTLVTSHSVTLTGLTPGILYDFAAISTNATGGSTTSTNSSFTTTAAPPAISNVVVSAITTTDATVTWTTDQPSNSKVNYGTSVSYGSSSSLSPLVTSHSVTLTGLSSTTTYDFDVASTNGASLTSTSANSTFVTLTPPPVISAVTVAAITATGATITWTTDETSTSVVNYGTTTGYGSTGTGTAGVTSHSVTLTALTAGTTYDFDVTSVNSTSGSTTSSNSTFATLTIPPVLSAIASSGITTTGATITWTTDQPSSSQVSYGTTTGYGTLTTANPTLVTSHSVTISGLTQSTTYDFAVISANASSQSTTSTNNTLLTATPAPAISAVVVSNITATGATITWTTDLGSSSQVFYGTTTAYGSQSTLNNTSVTSHSVTLTGLTAGTTYDFDVQSTNNPGGTSTSANSTFAALTNPPAITNVVSSSITTASATISWTTDEPSSSQVSYGTTTGYGTLTTANPTLVTSHSVTISGLTQGTTYDFAVISANAASQSTTSTNNTLLTLTPAPVISNVAMSNITTTGVTITWTTDLASSSVVNYGTTTGYGSTMSGTGGVTSHSVTLSGLTPGTLYDFDVASTNSPGGTTTSANSSFTTVNVPPTITNVAFSAVTSSSATITWTTNEPSSSLVNYGTTTGYGSASTLNSTLVTSHSVTITGLTSGTLYDFDVVSANSSSQSTTSGNSSFTTTAVPPVISNVAVSGITTTGATITWTTDQASSSVVNYGTTTGYGSTTSGTTGVTAHSVTLTGLTPGTTYDFDVTSANAGNGSATSANSTLATTPVPPTITNVATSGTTSIATTITWTTDIASSSQVFYGTTTGYGSQSALNSTLVTSHSVTITGLTPGTTYDFDVASTSSVPLTGTSTNSTVSTTAAPVISAVATSGTTSVATTITWTTDQPSSSQVNYGTTTAYGTQSTLNNTLVTSHSVTITGLAPGTTYDFDVVSVNGSTASKTSPNSTFVTTAAPVISAVASTGINSVSATITWTTDQASSSQVFYGTTVAYGSSSTLNSTLVTAHSVTINGLTPGTTYDFDVASTNASTATATSGNSTFATTPAPVISAVSAAVTTTTATITWTTDQASSTAVNYGTTTSYGSTGSGTGSVTSHSVTLTGLTPGTIYDYDVTSVNASTASTTSSNLTFTTTAVPPVISGVVVSGTTTTTATINWTTDQPSTSQVFFGTTTGYGSSSTLNSTLTTAHSVTITGLSPTTTFDFDVASTNSFSLTATSANSSFVTPAGTPPQVGYVVAWGISNTGAVVTWSTDVVANTQLAYGTTTALGQLSPLQTTLAASHGVTLTGLIPGTLYYFVAQSTGANGATGYSTVMSFTTTGTAPVGPPVISNVVVSGITNTSATITWTTDQASSSLVNFGTTTGYGSASTLDPTLVTSHTVTLTGLTLGTTYDFDVVSAAAMSATSGNSTFLTTSVVNTPPVITNVTTTNLTSTSATVTWTTDQPASSLVNYGTTTGYGSSSPVFTTLVTAHSVTLTGLTAGAAYDFDVVSANAAAQSTTSSNGTFNTPATTATPPNVGYVVAWGINNSGAVVTWSTDVTASTQLAYGTTTALGQVSPLDSTLAASHGVILSGLVSGTTYYFQAQSTGSNGATGYSTVMSFTTTGTAPVGPPVISNVVVSGITNTSATITWTTDQASSSLVNFGKTTGYGSTSTLDSTLVTSHSVMLTGLTLGTTYDFDVVSAAAMSATSGNSTFLTTSVVYTAPVISNVATSNLTANSVTVTWTTDQPASSLVNYGTTTSYGASSTLDPTMVTAHSVTLTGLTAGTAYDLDVVSANGAPQSTTSPNATFNTPATTAIPPNVGYVAAWGISNTGAVVTWSTDVLANTQLAYGTSTALGQLSPLQTTMAASHGVTLSSLNPGTTYYFVAQSTGADGATGYSTVMSFTTTGTQTTPPPTISAVTVTNITNTSATITWTTDQASSSLANYGVTTTYSMATTLDPTLVTAHSVTLTGLTPGTPYDFDVVSANSLALSSTSSNTTFTTTGTAPGPVITNVSTSGVLSGTATINWTTDQASTSVVNYGTTTGYGTTSTLAPLVTTHSVTLTGLTPNTTYDFDVVSANSANTTTTSTNFTFKTTSNSAPPPVISYLSYWGITASEATITWSTDTAANTAVAYGTTNALGQLSPVQTALTNSHGVTLTGLAAGTTYYFVAQSADGGGNTGYSTTYSFTTLQGPPTISGVTASPAAGNQATIHWTTSVPTNSYVQAGTSAGNYGYYSAQTNLTATPSCTLTYVPSGTIHYQLVSTDANGNQVVSADMTFVEP